MRWSLNGKMSSAFCSITFICYISPYQRLAWLETVLMQDCLHLHGAFTGKEVAGE